MLTLPDAADLERICRGLAMLDAIRCEAWEDRYFSFNAAWSDPAAGSHTERMASMRNGSGDEWFLVFVGTPDSGIHVFVKAFFHELPRANPSEVYRDCPEVLKGQLHEAAFSMDDVTFGGFFVPGQGWTVRGDADAMTDAQGFLSGDPETYRAFAADCFEVDLPLEAIERVLCGAPLDAALLHALCADRTVDELEEDRLEIGYP